MKEVVSHFPQNFPESSLVMKTHILVVDDSPVERRRIEHLLQVGIEDIIVTVAANGREALEALTQITPDVIVSDVRMPQMNGLEFIRELRSADQNIPVILMTSFGSEEIAVKALREGASGYVPKRGLETELIKTIHNLIAFSQQRQDQRRVVGSLSSAELHYTLDNDPELIAPLVSHLLNQMISMKLLKSAQVTRVGVAMQEAMKNAMYHGNLEMDTQWRQIVDAKSYDELAEVRRRQWPYADRQVDIKVSLSRHEVRFTIADDGPGFDSTKFDPTAATCLDRISGRGLLLIRSFMDRVTHNDRGNEITMVMHTTFPRTGILNCAPPHYEFKTAGICSQIPANAELV